MMFNRGFDGFGHFFSNGTSFMNSGWGFLIIGGVLLVVIAVIALLVRTGRGSGTSTNTSDAVEILTSRFVNGEITEEEYIRMKNVLGYK